MKRARNVSLPNVVVVGRPNVGKSTFVNRIIGNGIAIVEEQPGVTRDVNVLHAEWCGTRFSVVDTGGWLASGDELADKVSEKARRATAKADLVLFLVDGTTGITEEDERVAKWVRTMAKPVMLLVNKIDTTSHEPDIWEFTSLGVGEPFAISALHGLNSGDVLDEVVARLPEQTKDDVESTRVERVDVRSEPRIAIVGRPNVGKSTLFNRLVGEDRSIVHDMPGTTRDTIDTVVETEDGPIRFVDTAGMRRKTRIDEGPEYYSLVRALKAIDTVDGVIFVIDATDGVTHQDQRLAERIDVSGKPIVLALNKWELIDAEQRARVTAQIENEMGFICYAPLMKLSALTGKGTHKILPAIREAMDAYTRRLPTAEVTKVVQRAQQAHPAANARIYYAMQGAAQPPTFTLFANRTLQPHYLRYIERKLREHFALGPSPIKIRVRRK